MLTDLPTPSEMAIWDQAALALGVPDMVLMENAARAACAALVQGYGPVAGRRVTLMMGGGNNGGDAACMARHLLDAGAEVLVVHTRPLGRLRGMAGRHARLSARCGVPFVPAARWLRAGEKPRADRKAPDSVPSLLPDPLSDLFPDIIVDGLLGTGFQGSLRPLEAELIKRINLLGTRAFVLALDIPSGLDGMYGCPRPDAVRAAQTVTFAAAKPGLIVPEAAAWVGHLTITDIGMPSVVRRSHPASWRIVGPQDVAAIGRPEASGHKGTFGHVVVIGGSDGLSGAPRLSGLGALRSGAGLVTLAGPSSVVRDARCGCPDLMTRDLGPVWGAQAAQVLLPWLAGLGPRAALVCGPGLGRDDDIGREAISQTGPHAGPAALVAALLAWTERPVTVWDADALFVLAARPEWCAQLLATDIVTPHPGEAARLLGWSPAAVQADRLGALAGLVARAPAVWVLKGAGTLIGQHGCQGGMCPVASPNLGVGGSGDVLAGCVAGLAARGLDAFAAAASGVALHAAAGQLLATQYPRRGNTASDIADALARVPIA